MACSFINKNRRVSCGNTPGGIKSVWIAGYGSTAHTAIVSALETDGDKITMLDLQNGNHTFYKVDLDVESGSTFTQVAEVSRENHTSFVTQTLELRLAGIDLETIIDYKPLNKGKYVALVETYNEKVFTMGLENGVDFSLGMDTGSGFSEFNGYTLSGTALASELGTYVEHTAFTPSNQAIIEGGSSIAP